jgi:hypothetical protein
MAKRERATKNLAAVLLGSLGGRVRSKAQREASLRHIKRATEVRLARQRARKAAR